MTNVHDKKYSVIYCDPPWKYNDRKNTGTKFGGGAMGHYPVMSDADLLDMYHFIASIVANNCVMFMWATMPRLPFALRLLYEWGFRYCTNGFTWVKTNKQSGTIFTGPGYYTASNTELCLIGCRGSMPPYHKLMNSVVISPREEHSRKPDEVAERIERMYPTMNKIELFARRKRDCWDAWGMTGDMTEGGFLC